MLVKDVVNLLRGQHAMLAVAESCTGGGLAHEISSMPGISSVFLGGVIAYANSIKQEILGINQDVLLKYGAVSEEVALLMAHNCRQRFSSTWALSTTGIAGPMGATPDKPVGLVWIGLSGPRITTAHAFTFLHVSRLEHREKTINEALKILLSALKS
jgi:nicotinamide-nucleotide amidase